MSTRGAIVTDLLDEKARDLAHRLNKFVEHIETSGYFAHIEKAREPLEKRGVVRCRACGRRVVEHLCWWERCPVFEAVRY